MEAYTIARRLLVPGTSRTRFPLSQTNQAVVTSLPLLHLSVGSIIDRCERVNGLIDQLIESVHPREFKFYLETLARECDRLGYILTGADTQSRCAGRLVWCSAVWPQSLTTTRILARKLHEQCEVEPFFGLER